MDIDFVCGEFGFDVLWKEVTDTYVDCEVFEVVGGIGDVRIYERKGAICSDDTTPNIEEAQTYLTVSIKWDSCSHFDFGKEGYIHFCGVSAYKNHCKLLEFLYKRAFELMKRVPEPGEGW